MSKTKPIELKRSRNVRLLYSLAIVFFGLMFTYSAVKGGLLNYDDERYIAGNELIENLNFKTIQKQFTSFFDGHYHPLSLLSLAIDGQIGGDTIRAHHTVNLLFHLANGVLVFLFLQRLTQRDMLSFGTALLFVVHPINVESYAWMTERKNVQYSFFFLLSMINYLKYSKTEEKKSLLLSYLWAVLSLLSKAQAVVLLPVFFVIDFLQNRDFKSPRTYLEKLPALLLFLSFLWLTSAAQEETWGELNNSNYTQVDKLFLASHSFSSYFVKTLIPIGYNAYYPYPNDLGLELNFLHYASILALPLFIFLLWRGFKSNSIQFFGLSFFLLNVVLLLKFLDVPFGNYQMADRYVYLASIGLLLFILDILLKKFPQFERINQNSLLGLAAIAFLFGFISKERIKVWNNSQALWTDVIQDYPSYGHAYNMRALGALASGDFKAAKRDFEFLMEIDPDFEESYLNLAILNYRSNRLSEAVRVIEKGIALFPENIQLLEAAYTIFNKSKDSNKAESAINTLIRLEPENSKRTLMKGQLLFEKGEKEKARELLSALPNLEEANLLLKEWDRLDRIEQNPSLADLDSKFNQASELGKKGNYAEAQQLFDEILQLDPTNARAYLNRGSNYAFQRKFKEAVNDYLKGIELNPNEPIAYFLLATAYNDLGDKVNACINYKYAATKGVKVDPSLLRNCP